MTYHLPHDHHHLFFRLCPLHPLRKSFLLQLRRGCAKSFLGNCLPAVKQPHDVGQMIGFSTANYAILMTFSQDYVAESFARTGFDYLDEPTPLNDLVIGTQTGEEAISNTGFFGVIDNCGFPKDRYYL